MADGFILAKPPQEPSVIRHSSYDPCGRELGQVGLGSLLLLLYGLFFALTRRTRRRTRCRETYPSRAGSKELCSIGQVLYSKLSAHPIRIPSRDIDAKAEACVRAVASRARSTGVLDDEGLGTASALLRACVLALPRTIKALLELPMPGMLPVADLINTAISASPFLLADHVEEDPQVRADALDALLSGLPGATPDHSAAALFSSLGARPMTHRPGLTAATLRVLLASCVSVAAGWRHETSATLLHAVADCSYTSLVWEDAMANAARTLVSAGVDINCRMRFTRKTALGCSLSGVVATTLVEMGGSL